MNTTYFFKLILLMICIVFYSNALALDQNVLHLSLKEAIFLSLRYNQSIQSAELQRVVDKFSLTLARNQFEYKYMLTGSAAGTKSRSSGSPWGISRSYDLNPTITRQTPYGTNFSLAMTNPLSFSSSDPTNFYNPSLTLSVTQPLLQGSGRVIVEAALTHALIAEDNAKLTLKEAVITQVTQVITDYRALVTVENNLIIDEAALKSAKETVKQNELRIKNGLMAPSENVQAKLAVATQELSIASDRNAIIQAKFALLKDIGLEANTKIEIDKTISTKGVTYPKGEEAKKILFANNISYLQLLNQLKDSRLSLLQAEDSQRWTLDLSGQIIQGGGSGGGKDSGVGSLFNGRNLSRSVGLNLTVPIDDLSVQQNVVGAKVGYAQQRLAGVQLKISLETGLLGTLENLAILFEQIDLAKRAQDLAIESYHDALKKLAYGKASIFEVTTLQTSLISAQIAYVSNQIGYLNGVTSFQQNLGTTLEVWKIHLVY